MKTTDGNANVGRQRTANRRLVASASRVSRVRGLARAACVAASTLWFASLLPATACASNPLITDGLTLYYDFDQFTDRVTDGSSNGWNGEVHFGNNGNVHDAQGDNQPDIRPTLDSIRGNGSALFDTDATVPEDRIELCQTPPTVDSLSCDGLSPPLLPQTAQTIAAWVKVQEVAADQTIWTARSNRGASSQLLIDAEGRIAITLRGQQAGETLVDRQVYTDGSADQSAARVRYDDWFHLATTYDATAAQYAIYFNGQLIASGAPTFAGSLGVLGNWQQAATLGLGPGLARQLRGNLDEFYLFHRALSADEIAQLADLSGEPELGDFDGNGQLDVIDIESLSTAIRLQVNDEAFDVNFDGQVNGDDRDTWVHDLKRTYFGDVDLNGVFDSDDLIAVFISGVYEDAVPNNAAWWDGDWDGNGDFESNDLVWAFIDGGYEAGPRLARFAVPEPHLAAIPAIAATMLTCRRYKTRLAAAT